MIIFIFRPIIGLFICLLLCLFDCYFFFYYVCHFVTLFVTLFLYCDTMNFYIRLSYQYYYHLNLWYSCSLFNVMIIMCLLSLPFQRLHFSIRCNSYYKKQWMIIIVLYATKGSAYIIFSPCRLPDYQQFLALYKMCSILTE